MANLRVVLIGALVVGSVFFIGPSAKAVQVSNVDITCKKDGVEATYNTGWDSDNTYFEGVGDIAKFYCEGGHSPLGENAEYVSDTLGNGEGRYYTGESTATAEPTPTETTTPESEAATADPEPTVSQATYDALQKEYDDYKAWAEAAIADYKGTISGYINRIDSLKASLDERDKAISDLKAQLDARGADIDAYKTQIEQTQASLTKTQTELEKALQDLAKSKSDLEQEKAASKDLKAQLEASQKRVKELEIKLADVQAQLQAMTEKQDATEKQLTSAQETIATLTAQLKDANATILEQKKNIEELRAIMSNENTEQNLALAEEVRDIAEAKLNTSEPGSEEYKAGLALLAVAADADDPDLPEELAVIPVVGAVASQVLEAVNDISNVGADMTEDVRERSEEVVIAGVIVGGQVATASAVQATRRVRM